MYESFYGFRKRPFTLSPDPDYLFMSNKHENVYTYLRYAIYENKGFVVITGEIGSGKTTLLNYFLKRIRGPIKVAYIYNTTVSPLQFLRLVCQELSISVEGLDKAGILHALNEFLFREYAAGRRVILIVDEAQNLSLQTLEEIRLISNLATEKEPLWQIILVGQPELKRKLQHPSLKQLVQRITVYCHLEPLSVEEVKAYVRHRLRVAGARDLHLFTEDALEAIYEYSGGIPRLINILCDTALVYGFADELPRIDRKVIEAVAEDRRRSGLFEEVEALTKPEDNLTSFEDWPSRVQALEQRVRVLEALVAELSKRVEVCRSLERDWRGVIETLLRRLDPSRCGCSGA
ncbi:AAA family ATPase [Thermosulfurimonas sp. F29]|uniref:AAA family ATPase n=1 Tax=Thermosulfurimonas sp. F29 TaxID=2867247 RepID=UPI001C834F0B|nr:AAA family ATPase [Thermosulfurimonas sp. F29]MBX6421982.1 AAA family ATPase [Thermosulfurimonas sp. F29]